jgi:hypothetical protein
MCILVLNNRNHLPEFVTARSVGVIHLKWITRIKRVVVQKAQV